MSRASRNVKRMKLKKRQGPPWPWTNYAMECWPDVTGTALMSRAEFEAYVVGGVQSYGWTAEDVDRADRGRALYRRD
jgi:hypothetical protein